MWISFGMATRISTFLRFGILTMSLTIFLHASNTYASVITTPNQLLALDGSASSFTLGNDIELSASDGDPYIATFSGSLNGATYTISGLTAPLFNTLTGTVLNLDITTSADGVIGQGVLANTVEKQTLTIDGVTTTSGGMIENVTVDGSLSSASAGSGGLVGDLNDGSILNSTSDVIVNSTAAYAIYNNSYLQGAVGGLVGKLDYGGSITGSSATGNVTGAGNEVGGLVGQVNSGTISNSFASGDVLGHRGRVGGLVGQVNGGTISNSQATGVVTNGQNGDGLVGGLVGDLNGIVTGGSYATGNVAGASGATDVGGLVGFAGLTADINNSFSTGDVSGDINVGGLVGRITGGVISNSYSSSDVSNGSSTYTDGVCSLFCAVDNFGGLVGFSGKQEGWQGSVREIVSGYDANNSPLYVTTSTVIENSYASGDVVVSGDGGGDMTGVGGLVGYSQGSIFNSYASGKVSAGTRIGGLVGQLGPYSINPNLNTYVDNELVAFLNENGLIKNSYAVGSVNEFYNGANRMGGLVGVNSGGKISNSYATAGGVSIDASTGADHIGGLVGQSEGVGIIENSFAFIDGSVIAGSPGSVGGLAGSFDSGSVTGSYAYIGGEILGYTVASSGFAGLIGITSGSPTITNSYISFAGTVFGSGGASEHILPEFPSLLSVLNSEFENTAFEVVSCLNVGLPILITLQATYDSSACGGQTNNLNKVGRSFATLNTLQEVLKSIGFRGAETSRLKMFGIQLLGNRAKSSVGVNQLVKLFDYANTSILFNKENSLQISFSSYYKEPVQIWIQDLNGTYVLLGNLEFDNDGEAVLPSIKFDKPSIYQLLIVKYAEDSTGGPNLENQLGQISIFVD